MWKMFISVPLAASLCKVAEKNLPTYIQDTIRNRLNNKRRSIRRGSVVSRCVYQLPICPLNFFCDIIIIDIIISMHIEHQ